MAVPEHLGGRLRRARRESTALDELIELTRSDGDGLERVLTAIGEQRRPETLQAIAPHLHAKRAPVRAAAVIAAVRADPQGAHDLVLPLLDDERAAVQQAVAEAARSIATPADLPALEAAARNAPPMMRDDLAWALAATCDPAALPALRLLAGDRSRRVRRDAREALIWSSIPGAETILATNPIRLRPLRLRDARRAARAIKRAEADDPLVVSTAAVRVGPGAAFTFAAVAAMVGVPVALGAASAWMSVAALLAAFVVTAVIFGELIRQSPVAELRAHERARFEGQVLPRTARIIRPWSLALRRLPALVLPRQLLITAMIVGPPIALELLLPAGGAVSGGSPDSSDISSSRSDALVERSADRRSALTSRSTRAAGLADASGSLIDQTVYRLAALAPVRGAGERGQAYPSDSTAATTRSAAWPSP